MPTYELTGVHSVNVSFLYRIEANNPVEAIFKTKRKYHDKVVVNSIFNAYGASIINDKLVAYAIKNWDAI